jgi:hypothetical protein
MATLNQERVIAKIKKKVREGAKISISAEMKPIYSKRYAEHPDRFKKGKGVQEKLKPLIEQLENERLEALEEARKKRGTAQYAQLMQAVKDLTNQIQLLGGGDTERIKIIQVDSDIAKKNDTDSESKNNSERPA